VDRRGRTQRPTHNDPLQVLDGAVAWSIKQSGAAFTAAGYQQVAVTPGDTLRASAYGWVYTCNDAIKSALSRNRPITVRTRRWGISARRHRSGGGLDPLATSVNGRRRLPLRSMG